MAILNAETLALLSGKSFAFTGLSVDGTAGTPPRDQQFDFGAVSTIAGNVSIVADSEVNGVDYLGGRFTAKIGGGFELESLRYEYLSAKQRVISLDLDGVTLTIDYGNYIETYTQL